MRNNISANFVKKFKIETVTLIMNITLNQFKLQYITRPLSTVTFLVRFFSFLALLLKSSNDYYLPSLYDLEHDIISTTFIGWIPLDSFG